MTVPVFDFVGKKKICIICEGYEEKEYLYNGIFYSFSIAGFDWLWL